jgi:hypothetical protein
MDALSNLCLKCHDSENDVHFLNVGVVERWLGGKNPVVHRTPAPKNNNGNGKGPGVQKDERPPIVIEIFEEKKK